MKIKKGRKNVIEFINEEIVRKINIVSKESRIYPLKIEAWALSQAKDRGINVPEVIDYHQNAKGLEILVLERIHGRSLSLNTSKENSEILADIGRQMMSLKNVSVNYGWINPISLTGISGSWQDFLLFYTKKYGERLQKEKIITENQLQKVCRIIEYIDFEVSNPYLVNRDIRLPHLIVDNKNKVWILDWENVILGDPLYDLAFFGVRYGHGILWQSLRLGYGFTSLPQKYTLYEITALIGLIDFCRKNRIKYSRKLRKLIQLIDSI